MPTEAEAFIASESEKTNGSVLTTVRPEGVLWPAGRGQGGKTSETSIRAPSLHKSHFAATQNVDEKLISKLLDHVAEVTGCRRGRLQAKNLLAITTSSPIRPQGGSTGSSSCTAVTMSYRIGQCDAAVLRRYSALQPTAGHRMTGHGHGWTDRSPLQAAEMHLLLFAPPVSGRK